MEYPSSNPGGPLLFAEGEDDSFWGSIFSQFPHESLFTPEPDHHQANTDTGPAANPSADVAIGAPTCGAQAARAASHTRAGINPISNPNPIPDARTDPRWTAPGTARTAGPVPPSALSDIARVYAASVSSRGPDRSLRTSLPAQPSPSWDVVYPDRPLDTANWLPLNQSQAAAYQSQQRLEGPPVAPGSFPTLDLPYPPFDSALALPTTLAQLTQSATAGPNPTLRGNEQFLPYPLDYSLYGVPDDGDSGSPPNTYNTPSWLGASYPLSPLSHMSEDVSACDHERRASTSSTGATALHANIPRPSPPKAQRPKREPTSPTTPLAFVQYRPNSGTDSRSSKKRPAFEEITPQGMTSQTLRQTLVRDDDGEVKGAMITFGNRVKNRAVFTEEKRQQTAQARREGVCPRCKESKRGCDLAQKSSYVSCTLCSRSKLYKNRPRHPCFKVTLADILFFRSGPAANEPFFTARRTVYDLGDLSKPDVPVRTLKLTQSIGPHQLTVYASEFIPAPIDVVSYKWRDGSGAHRELKMPPFCLTNIDKIQTHFRQYIDLTKWSYLTSLKSEDDLAWMTISTAMKYAKTRPDSLVADTLSLWAISRMIEIPWQMCGTDTLGVSPVRDATSPHHGKIPIPPIMDTQLDQIVIRLILNPLRAKVVHKFEQLITPAKRENWWEVYLSAFVMLNHIERLAMHSVAHAKTHTMASKYSNIPFLEGVFHTAKSILARFHFVCNGSAPLRLDWTSPDATAMAKLEPGQVKFMQKTQAMIAAREKDVLSLRATHKYEKTLYWAGQLFTESFDTSPVRVVEVEEEEGGDGELGVKREA